MDYPELEYDPYLAEEPPIEFKDLPFSSTTIQESAKKADEHGANTGKIAPMDYPELEYDLDLPEEPLIECKDVPFSSITIQESAKEADEHGANTGKIAPSPGSPALVHHSLPAEDLRPIQDEDATGLETFCQPLLKYPKINFHGSPSSSITERMFREFPGSKHKEALETSKIKHQAATASMLDSEDKNESLLKQDETWWQACNEVEYYLKKTEKLSDANALLRSRLELALEQEEKEKAHDLFDKHMYARLMDGKEKFSRLKHANKSLKCDELGERLTQIEAGAVQTSRCPNLPIDQAPAP